MHRALCLALLALPATAEGPDPDALLAALAETVAHAPEATAPPDLGRFLELRAELNDLLLAAPPGAALLDYFSVDSDLPYSWVQYRSGHFAAVAAEAPGLEMDRARWFASLALAPFAITWAEADPCVAQKALRLMAAGPATPEEARFAAAIPATAEAARRLEWADNAARHRMVYDLDLNMPEIERAALSADIIATALLSGGFNPNAIRTQLFFNHITGRQFSAAEVEAALAGIDAGLQADIAAAQPFFARYAQLLTLDAEAATAKLCR